MKRLIKVRPPDPVRYKLWCVALQRDLEDEAVPPFEVAYMCREVLVVALGGKFRLLCWLVLQLICKAIDEWKDACWWAWHLHIRQRTIAEIEEITIRHLEEITGVQEWPDLMSDDDTEDKPSRDHAVAKTEQQITRTENGHE